MSSSSGTTASSTSGRGDSRASGSPRSSHGSRPASIAYSDHGELVEVGRDARGLPEEPLGRHVRGRPAHAAFHASSSRRARSSSFAIPKSSSTACLPATMNTFSGLRSRWIEPLRVERPDRAAQLREQLERGGERHRAAREHARERLAVEALHREVGAAIGQLADREHLDHRRVRDRLQSLAPRQGTGRARAPCPRGSDAAPSARRAAVPRSRRRRFRCHPHRGSRRCGTHRGSRETPRSPCARPHRRRQGALTDSAVRHGPSIATFLDHSRGGAVP